MVRRGKLGATKDIQEDDFVGIEMISIVGDKGTRASQPTGTQRIIETDGSGAVSLCYDGAGLSPFVILRPQAEESRFFPSVGDSSPSRGSGSE
jgi:hypothetical protein